jgi:hypothetical protein
MIAGAGESLEAATRNSAGGSWEIKRGWLFVAELNFTVQRDLSFMAELSFAVQRGIRLL